MIPALDLMKMRSFLHLTLVLAVVGCTSAGQGGTTYMINLSGFDWHKAASGSYQMNSFNFPDIIKAGETASVYVEFGQKIFHVTSDDSGYVVYKSENGDKAFQIEAHGDGFRIVANFLGLKMDGRTEQFYNMGWHHDGDNIFILINNNDLFTGSGLDAANWMKNNIGWLGPRRLMDISIPGTHDSGMSTINGHTAFGSACEVKTQSKSILGQLDLGARYFDIRPVIGNGGKYLTGHYGHIPGSYQGANGQSIDSIVQEINEFTRTHNELIIISLSHTYNTDVGSNSYRAFTESEWDGLFNKLDNIQSRYHGSSSLDLRNVTLSEFTNVGTKAAVVFIVDGDNAKLGSRMGQGYFLPENIQMYDNYANTDNLSHMESDQVTKMKENSRKNYFLLSWTLTMQSICFDKSVESLAHQVRRHVGRGIYPEVSDSAFPNIVLVDYLEDTDIAALVLGINKKVHF